MADLKSAIAAADAVIIATPEYNHSIPGQLKNALDWLSRPLAESPLRNKPAAVVGTSTGLFGAVWAQAEVRKALKASGAHVLETELPVGMADGAFDDDGSLADPELTARLGDLVGCPDPPGDVVGEAFGPVESVTAGVVEPRYPSFKGIMAAKKKPLEVKPAELGEVRLVVEKMELPPDRPPGRPESILPAPTGSPPCRRRAVPSAISR